MENPPADKPAEAPQEQKDAGAAPAPAPGVQYATLIPEPHQPPPQASNKVGGVVPGPYDANNALREDEMGRRDSRQRSVSLNGRAVKVQESGVKKRATNHISWVVEDPTDLSDQPKNIKIELYHGTVFGKRLIKVNGEEVFGKKFNFFDSGSEHVIPVSHELIFTIRIMMDRLGFIYQLLVNGQPCVAPNMEVLANDANADAQLVSGPAVLPDGKQSEPLRKPSITRVRSSTINEGSGKEVKVTESGGKSSMATNYIMWEIEHAAKDDTPAKKVNIELWHGIISGKRLLKANNEVILKQSYRLLDGGSEHPFAYDGHDYVVLIKENGMLFGYGLMVDGVPFQKAPKEYQPASVAKQATEQQKMLDAIGGSTSSLNSDKSKKPDHKRVQSLSQMRARTVTLGDKEINVIESGGKSGVGTNYLRWEVELPARDNAPSKVCSIELWHGTIWGKRLIKVDGQKVMKKRFNLLDSGSEHSFTYEQVDFRVVIEEVAFKFQYRLFVNNQPVQAPRQQVASSIAPEEIKKAREAEPEKIARHERSMSFTEQEVPDPSILLSNAVPQPEQKADVAEEVPAVARSLVRLQQRRASLQPPTGWEIHFTEDAVPFFYNPATGESRWERPDGLGERSVSESASADNIVHDEDEVRAHMEAKLLPSSPPSTTSGDSTPSTNSNKSSPPSPGQTKKSPTNASGATRVVGAGELGKLAEAYGALDTNLDVRVPNALAEVNGKKK